MFDLPEVRSEVIEHCLYDAVCPHCRKRQVARLPDTVPRGQMGQGNKGVLVTLTERVSKLELITAVCPQNMPNESLKRSLIY